MWKKFAEDFQLFVVFVSVRLFGFESQVVRSLRKTIEKSIHRSSMRVERRRERGETTTYSFRSSSRPSSVQPVASVVLNQIDRSGRFSSMRPYLRIECNCCSRSRSEFINASKKENPSSSGHDGRIYLLSCRLFLLFDLFFLFRFLLQLVLMRLFLQRNATLKIDERENDRPTSRANFSRR